MYWLSIGDISFFLIAKILCWVYRWFRGGQLGGSTRHWHHVHPLYSYVPLPFPFHCASMPIQNNNFRSLFSQVVCSRFLVLSLHIFLCRPKFNEIWTWWVKNVEIKMNLDTLQPLLRKRFTCYKYFFLNIILSDCFNKGLFICFYFIFPNIHNLLFVFVKILSLQ